MTVKDTAVPALETIYDDLWSRGRWALTSGHLVCDPLPAPGTSRWGLSAVFRPWSSAFADCAAACAELIGPRGVVYGEDNLHVTLRSFEGWRSEVGSEDEALPVYRDALASIVADGPAPRVRFRGLTASASGVLVQGWPLDDVQALRTRLHAVLHDRLLAAGLPMTGPEASRGDLRRTVHATLAMYGPTVAEPHALSAFVERHRETDFGEQRFETVWLVGYRRTSNRVDLIPYGRFDVGGPR
jgi:hypothetical protein